MIKKTILTLLFSACTILLIAQQISFADISIVTNKDSLKEACIKEANQKLKQIKLFSLYRSTQIFYDKEMISWAETQLEFMLLHTPNQDSSDVAIYLLLNGKNGDKVNTKEQNINAALNAISIFERNKDRLGLLVAKAKFIQILASVETYNVQKEKINPILEEVRALAKQSSSLEARILLLLSEARIKIYANDSEFLKRFEQEALAVLSQIEQQPQFNFYKETVYNQLARYYWITKEYKKSLGINLQLVNGNRRHVYLYNAGNDYREMNDYNHAISYYKLAIEETKKKDVKNLDFLVACFENLHEVYQKKQDLKNAVSIGDSLVLYTKLLFQEEREQKVAEAQTKYETMQKSIQNETLLKDKKRLQYVILIISLSMLSVLVLGIWNYRVNRRNKELLVFREHIFSIIAHDLRNPLTAFQDLADLIKYSLVEKRFEDIDEIAEAIDKSSLKLRLLTDNFFQWAFSQQFQLKPNPERIVLLPVIHKIIGYYEHGIMFKKGTFAIDCNELASVYMDAKDLETILRNLIDNAVKMAQVEHPFCSIAVSTDAEKTLIKIKNNGLTIDEKKQSVIQQLFKNNTNIQPYKNDIGFGLWLVANYTHKNKGAISFSSKENDETAFALTFPTDLHSSIDHKH